MGERVVRADGERGAGICVHCMQVRLFDLTAISEAVLENAAHGTARDQVADLYRWWPVMLPYVVRKRG